MKIQKTAVLFAFLTACSRGEVPAGAEQEPQPATPSAQTAPAPAQPASPGAPAPQRELTPVEKKVQEAFALIEKGDGGGAIRILEELRAQKQATPPVLALLGAVYLQEGRANDALDVLRPLAEAEDADPAVLYNAGRAALAAGQAAAGQRFLERSVAKAPVSPAARELGLLLSRQGRVIEAYRQLRPWAMSNSDDLEARIIAATLALRLERPADAEEILSGLAEKEPAIQLLRAQARIQRGDGKTALALLQPIEKDHPAGVDLEVRRTLAEAHLLAGNPASALKVLEGHTANHPGLILLVAKAQRQSGNAQAAMATLKPLVDQIPADAKVVGDPRPAAGVATEYGRLLLAAGNAQGALPLLEKATRLHPSSREAWEVYADVLTAAGRAQDAAQARQKAKEIADAMAASAPAPAAAARPAAQANAPALSPNLAEAMRLMAGGENEKALEKIRKEIVADPANDRARVLEVQLLMREKRFADALKASEAALKADPQNPDFVYQRGAVQIALKKLTEAERDLRHALQMAPRHLAAMNDLAIVMMIQGKPSEAQKLLEQVLAINPNDQNARNSLESLKQELAGKGKGKG